MALDSPRRSARATKKPRLSYADSNGPIDVDDESPSSSFVQDDASDDDAVPPIVTPSRPTKTARRTPSKKKTDDADDVELGNTPDLEVISTVGTSLSARRMQSRSAKSRATRAEWALGLYEPPDLALCSPSLPPGLNEDEKHQPSTPTSAAGLPWPDDGLAHTRLDSTAFANLKKERYKFWCAQTGWVPKESLYDIAWWPGRPFGYKACQKRTDWVLEQQHHFSPAPHGRVGWPFTNPALAQTSRGLQVLSTAQAEAYLKGTTSSSMSEASVALRHPITVTKFSVIQSTASKKSQRKAIDDRDNDDFAADEQVQTEADQAQSNNQEYINVDDPKFANIVNVGWHEPLPVTGASLEITVGMPGREHEVSIRRGTGMRLDSAGLPLSHSHIINVGGHVYDLCWAPVPIHLNRGKEYFAVSAASVILPRTFIGQKHETPLPGSIQIWSVSPDTVCDGVQQKGQTKLEMVMCHELGTAWKISWCPLGHSYLPEQEQKLADFPMRRLGMLAGCFEDGSTSVFSIPYPEQIPALEDTTVSIMLKLEPALRLTLPQAASNCLSWAGGESLAVGTSDGHVAVWDVGKHFRSAASPAATPLLPTSYSRVHRAAITSLNWILLPPITATGIAKHDMNPTQIFTVSVDGWTCVLDLLDPTTSASLERSRSMHYASEFVPHAGGVLAHENGDGSIAYYSLRAEEMYRSRVISHTPARVLALSCSSFHPMLAAGTAHGELKTCNILRSTKRSGKQHTQRIHLPIYQLRLNRSTGQLGILHNLNPQMASKFEHKSWKISTWNTILNITAVQWNPNFGRANLLLSGSAAGMVKVDCVNSPFD